MTGNITGIIQVFPASVPALATFSAIGFALNLGIATVAPAAFSALSEVEQIEIITNRALKIISIFVRTEIIFSYFALSMLFMLGGITLVDFIITSATQELVLSAWLVGIAMAATFILAIIVVVLSFQYNQADLDLMRRALFYYRNAMAHASAGGPTRARGRGGRNKRGGDEDQDHD